LYVAVRIIHQLGLTLNPSAVLRALVEAAAPGFLTLAVSEAALFVEVLLQVLSQFIRVVFDLLKVFAVHGQRLLLSPIFLLLVRLVYLQLLSEISARTLVLYQTNFSLHLF